MSQLQTLVQSHFVSALLDTPSSEMADSILQKLWVIMKWTSAHDGLIKLIEVLIRSVRGDHLIFSSSNEGPLSAEPFSEEFKGRPSLEEVDPIDLCRSELLRHLSVLHCLCSTFIIWQQKLRSLYDTLGLNSDLSDSQPFLLVDLLSFIGLTPASRCHMVFSSLAPLFIRRSESANRQLINQQFEQFSDARAVSLEIDSATFRNLIIEIFILPTRQTRIRLDAVYECRVTSLAQFWDRDFDSTQITEVMQNFGLVGKSDSPNLELNELNESGYPMPQKEYSFNLFKQNLSNVDHLIVDSMLIDYVGTFLLTLNTPDPLLNFMISPYALALGISIDDGRRNEVNQQHQSRWENLQTRSSYVRTESSWISEIGYLSSSVSSMTNSTIILNVRQKAALRFLPLLLLTEIIGRTNSTSELQISEDDPTSSYSLKSNSTTSMLRSNLLRTILLKIAITRIECIKKLPAFCIMDTIDCCISDLPPSGPSDVFPTYVSDDSAPSSQTSCGSSQVEVNTVESEPPSFWLHQTRNQLAILHRLRSLFSNHKYRPSREISQNGLSQNEIFQNDIVPQIFDVDFFYRTSTLKWTTVADVESNSTAGIFLVPLVIPLVI